jgi:hypothetical protein
MQLMLNIFLAEPAKAGHFTCFRVENADQSYKFKATGHQRLSSHWQHSEKPQSHQEPTKIQARQDVTSPEHWQQLAHIGSWTKDTYN